MTTLSALGFLQGDVTGLLVHHAEQGWSIEGVGEVPFSFLITLAA